MVHGSLAASNPGEDEEQAEHRESNGTERAQDGNATVRWRALVRSGEFGGGDPEEQSGSPGVAVGELLGVPKITAPHQAAVSVSVSGARAIAQTRRRTVAGAAGVSHRGMAARQLDVLHREEPIGR